MQRQTIERAGRYRFRSTQRRFRMFNMPTASKDVQFRDFRFTTDDQALAKRLEESDAFRRGRIMREPDIDPEQLADEPAPDTTRDGRGDEGNQKGQGDDPDTTRDGRGDEGANKPAKRTRNSTASKKTASKKAGSKPRRRGTKKSP